MAQSPEQQAKERMDDNLIVTDYRRATEMIGKKPTYPELVEYKRKRKAVSLGQPTGIIEGDEEDDAGGDDDVEEKSAKPKSRRMHR